MKPKTKTIIFILMSFLLGILCGWFIEERVFTKMRHSKVRSSGDFMNVLTERLHLDHFQVVQIDSILDSRRQKMEIYKKHTLAMRDSARMEIRKILNAEQIVLFDQFVQEKDRKEAGKRGH